MAFVDANFFNALMVSINLDFYILQILQIRAKTIMFSRKDLFYSNHLKDLFYCELLKECYLYLYFTFLCLYFKHLCTTSVIYRIFGILNFLLDFFRKYFSIKFLKQRP